MVHVHITYYPVVSGLSIVTQKLAEGMAKLELEVHVTTSTRSAKSRPRYEVLNGVHVCRVRSLKPPYENPTYPLEYPIDVIKHADIIHGHHQSLFTTKMSYRVKHMINGILAYPRNPKTSKSNNIYIASDKNLATKLSSESKKNLVAWNEVIAILLQIYTKAKMQVE